MTRVVGDFRPFALGGGPAAPVDSCMCETTIPGTKCSVSLVLHVPVALLRGGVDLSSSALRAFSEIGRSRVYAAPVTIGMDELRCGTKSNPACGIVRTEVGVHYTKGHGQEHQSALLASGPQIGPCE